MNFSKTRFLAAGLLGVATIAPVPASAEGPVPARAAAAASAGIPRPTAFGHFGNRSSHHRDLDELLKEIAAWVSLEFDLPAVQDVPAISFASARRMIPNTRSPRF